MVNIKPFQRTYPVSQQGSLDRKTTKKLARDFANHRYSIHPNYRLTGAIAEELAYMRRPDFLVGSEAQKVKIIQKSYIGSKRRITKDAIADLVGGAKTDDVWRTLIVNGYINGHGIIQEEFNRYAISLSKKDISLKEYRPELKRTFEIYLLDTIPKNLLKSLEGFIERFRFSMPHTIKHKAKIILALLSAKTVTTRIDTILESKGYDEAVKTLLDTLRDNELSDEALKGLVYNLIRTAKKAKGKQRKLIYRGLYHFLRDDEYDNSKTREVITKQMMPLASTLPEKLHIELVAKAFAKFGITPGRAAVYVLLFSALSYMFGEFVYPELKDKITGSPDDKSTVESSENPGKAQSRKP